MSLVVAKLTISDEHTPLSPWLCCKCVYAALMTDSRLKRLAHRRRYTGEEPGGEAFEAGQSSNFLHAGEDFSAPSTFHQEAVCLALSA